MKKKILATATLLAITPSIVIAQVPTTNLTYFTGLVGQIKSVLNALVPVLIVAGVVYFLWGVLQFVSAGDDEEGRKAGRSRMIHGVIAIFVMASIWGLVGLLGTLTGVGGGSVIVPPIVP